jgi:hypothetical protein
MRALLVAGLVVSLLAVGSVPAFADGAQPSGGLTGFDVSSLGCGAQRPYGAFGVAGVNAGRPFHYNPCLAAQYAPGEAVYLNTAYDDAYLNRIRPECTRSARRLELPAAEAAAWGVGCSEAEGSIAYASSALPAPPSMWWLDVEILNSWSSPPLNRRALEGVIATLQSTGVPIGVYSTGYQWGVITGGWTTAAITADWVAGAQSADDAPLHCESGFTGAPVWLVQYTRGPADFDFVC